MDRTVGNSHAESISKNLGSRLRFANPFIQISSRPTVFWRKILANHRRDPKKDHFESARPISSFNIFNMCRPKAPGTLKLASRSS